MIYNVFVSDMSGPPQGGLLLTWVRVDVIGRIDVVMIKWTHEYFRRSHEIDNDREIIGVCG